MSTHERFTPHTVTDKAVDRAVLVAADRGRGWSVDDSLAELERLAETAGAVVVARLTQKLSAPDSKTFIHKGKLEEVAETARELEASLIIFDDELSPSQQANIENAVPETKIADRTALILDIFALHATSREGKLQVELAQMEYLLPRLRGLWRHLDRFAGGGVLTRGPGESQLETDRRLARKRIGELKRELVHVAGERELQRKARVRSGVFRVSLVGYTNAGKSTTLNALTDADVLVADKLFATLDATTRTMELSEGRIVTITDTVGFIHKLPHSLVQAFKSTLDEVREADLLIHVVDGSHPQAFDQIAAVQEVLGEIGAADRPSLVVFNKADAMEDEARSQLVSRYPHAVICSALTGEGLDTLRDRVAAEAARQAVTLTILVPYDRGDLVALAHEHTQIVSEEHTGEGTRMVVRASVQVAGRLEPFAQHRRPAAAE
ncbi:MAG TPA: GTPase HflX [Coriobacteriia bacterium]